ncbi:MAG: hypothetical protein M3238_05210, partial [Actinomycetota bacterium]|nr:hypothetical protein [Actinomycetota bacterium]
VRGSSFNDVINGTAGSDWLWGEGGHDRISGLHGDDLVGGDAGDDFLQGGPGYDFVDYYYATGPVDVSLVLRDSYGDGVDRLSGFQGIVGSEYDDILVGNSDHNSFQALGGNDTVTGGGGLDWMVFADGPVRADLGTGTARGEGRDRFSEIEALAGSDEDDILVGSDGNDALDGWGGNDVLNGKEGDDYLIGDEGDDRIDGGAGSYDLVEFFAAASITADLRAGTASGEGADELVGIEGLAGSVLGDVLIGNDSANFLFGNGGDDRIEGGGGDDMLDAGEGIDALIGGDGSDDCFGAESSSACEGARPIRQHPLFVSDDNFYKIRFH